MDCEFGRELNEGILAVTIDDVKSFPEGGEVESMPVVIQTLPWKMTVSNGYNENLFVKFKCNDSSASTLWNCSAKINVTATMTKCHGEDVKIDEKQTTEMMDYSKNQCTILFDTAAWHEYADAKRLRIDAKVVLTRVTGVRKRKIVDYSAEQPSLFNGILLIEGRKVHVNKQLLTMHSVFFENLFFGDFAENKQETITLHDVKYSEFCDFLDIIHPTLTEVEKKTVESLLKLADRFQAEEVAGRCEKFLIDTKEVPMAKKLILAQQYRLGELMDKCLKSFNSLEDMFPLKKSEFYGDINDDVKSALLERLIKINDEADE